MRDPAIDAAERGKLSRPAAARRNKVRESAAIRPGAE